MVAESYPIPETLKQKLDAVQSSDTRLALLTCGLTGSGKSTLARTIVSQYPSFVRLSIDKHIFEHHGVYGVDYSASRYPELQKEAEVSIIQRLKETLKEGKRDVVLDLSFWNREMRDEYRELIGKEGKGGKGGYEIVLVVFKGTEEVLWMRVEGRRIVDEEKRGKGEGGEGMSVSRDVLRGFIKGFEWPGEDEECILIEVV